MRRDLVKVLFALALAYAAGVWTSHLTTPVKAQGNLDVRILGRELNYNLATVNGVCILRHVDGGLVVLPDEACR